MIHSRILSMPQNAGLIALPQNPLTSDIRQILQSAGQSGGALTAGLPGLSSPYGMAGLQSQAYGGRQSIAVTLSSSFGGMAPGAELLLSLHPTDVHVLEELDTMISGYSPAEFRADEAVPLVSVEQLTDYFRTFSENNAFKQVPVLASTQSDINEVDPETVLRTYQCLDRALGGFVPTVTQHVARKAFDPMQALLRRVNWGLALDREVRVFGGTTGVLVADASWNANNIVTIAGGSEWNTTNGDPIKNLQDAEELSVMPITDWWMSTPSLNAFLRNEKVRSHMRQLLGDNAPSPDVVNRKRDIVIPGLAPIHQVPGKVLNETSGNIEYIMTDRVVGTHTPISGGNVNPEDIQTAVTFRFNGPSGTGFITRQFDLPRRGLHSGQMVVSGYSEDVRFIASNCGALIKNSLA